MKHLHSRNSELGHREQVSQDKIEANKLVMMAQYLTLIFLGKLHKWRGFGGGGWELNLPLMEQHWHGGYWTYFAVRSVNFLLPIFMWRILMAIASLTSSEFGISMFRAEDKLCKSFPFRRITILWLTKAYLKFPSNDKAVTMQLV